MSLEQAIDKLTIAVNDLVIQVAGTRSDKVPLAAPAATTDANAPSATPAKRGRPAKVEQAAPSAPALAVVEKDPLDDAANDSSFLDDDEPTPPAKAATKDDVRAALVTLQKAKGSPEASRAILKQFKAETLGSLKEADYAAVIASVSKQLPKAA